VRLPLRFAPCRRRQKPLQTSTWDAFCREKC
jgi:hypothetical protein